MARRWVHLGLPALLLGGGLTLLPSCGVRYVARSAWYQLELLGSREPAAEVLASGVLTPEEADRLALVPRIKAYGQTLGLSSTDNYDTVAVGWNRTIWNVSACPPFAFEPVTWWFPIVGRVPYLGYFTDEEAIAKEQELLAQGHEVYRRTAGAYSTLGWFRDPVLPSMLRWTEAELAETVFHELAHATLWVPGSVAFNESFANFVGEQANYRYLADRYGPHSTELRDVLVADGDWALFEQILHQLYQELEAVYQDESLDEATRLSAKTRLYASLPERVSASEIRNKPRYLDRLSRSTWNNARLVQFRVYNAEEAAFTALLTQEDGDLRRFIDTVGRVTRRQKDPFEALRRAAETPVQNP